MSASEKHLTYAQRPLGAGGPGVTPLTFGAMLIARDPGLKDGVSPALLRALEGGVGMIDTARIYPGSEDIIAATLKSWTGPPPLLSSKVAPLGVRTFRHYAPIAEAFTAASIRASVEASLKALNAERLDVIHLHQWFYLWSFEPEWHQTLLSLREEGKIDRIAVSAQDHEHDATLEVIRAKQVDVVQFIYNLFESRPCVSLLPMAAKHGVGTIARCVLDSGALTGTMDEAAFKAHHFLSGTNVPEYQRRLDALKRDFLGGAVKSLDELAIRFVLSDPRVSTITLGLVTVAEVDRALKLVALPPLAQAEIEAISAAHVWTKNAYERLV